MNRRKEDSKTFIMLIGRNFFKGGWV